MTNRREWRQKADNQVRGFIAFLDIGLVMYNYCNKSGNLTGKIPGYLLYVKIWQEL